MSSDVGTIMDALVDIVEAGVYFPAITAERTIKYPAELNDDQFPYCCVYDPDETSELGEFHLATKKTTVSLLLFEKDGTQESLALKMDTIRDDIEADRTLGALVEYAHCASRSILEEPGQAVKAGHIVVETTKATGRLYHVVVEVGVVFNPVYSNWATNLNTIRLQMASHLGNVFLGGAVGNSEWRTDRDTIPADAGRAQLRATLAEILESGDPNLGYMRAELELHYWHHIGPSTVEITAVETTIMDKLDGVLNAENWRSPAAIHHLESNPRITLAGVERMDI